MTIKRILIIDDQADFCKLIKMSLEKSIDYDVDFATDGRKGIKLAKKMKPDLIILDIAMPGMDGFQVLEKIKQDDSLFSIPVIMLTGNADERSKQKAAQLYSEHYITKPVEFDVLKTEIEEILKIKKV